MECNPLIQLTFEQLAYLVKLAMVWSYAAFVVWWWVTKVLNPMIGLWVEFGLLYLITGDWRLARQTSV